MRPGITVEKTVSLTGQCPGQNVGGGAGGHDGDVLLRVTNTGDTHLVDVTGDGQRAGRDLHDPGPLAPGASHDLHEDGHDQPGHDERGHGHGHAVG